MNFGTRDLHVVLLSVCEFRENRLSALLHLKTSIMFYLHFSSLLSNFMVKFG